MKIKLLYLLLATLIITNGAMVFMLINKPHQQKKGKENFLVTALQFDEGQIERFDFFEEEHRETMKSFDREIRQSKEVLFNSFSIPNFSSENLSKKIGQLEGQKEQELFVFFKQVRTICKPEQVVKFDRIIKKALHRKGGKPPEEGKRPPPPR